jgi:uncharacterized protein YbbC (DUF1343 family)
MKNIKIVSGVVLISLLWFHYGTPPAGKLVKQADSAIRQSPVQTGADQLDIVLPSLRNKRLALVVNHTAVIGKTHLADTLQSYGMNIVKVFAPEHGFRGTEADGATIKDGTDSKTGLPVVSLYGANKKPTTQQLADVDIVIFDIQDVGARFYTYISTLHYVMEACAEQKKKLLILDRPNPNGGYVDGPVLEPAMKSFVGMHPIPVVHGLTVGELAQMINGESWLKDSVKCDVEVIPVRGWKHADPYSLAIRPSPNLPNDTAIVLYPSLCLFEGTVISVGRGTQTPFLVLGNPFLKGMPFKFTPKSIPGMSTNPPHLNKLCYGIDLRKAKAEPKFSLQHLIDFYKRYPNKEKFFNASFNRLAGTPKLQQQIKKGMSEEAIRKTWAEELTAYKSKREKYLLYQ